MIPSDTFLLMPACPTTPFERLARLFKDILIASELAGYEQAGLITEQERFRLFSERREVPDAVQAQ